VDVLAELAEVAFESGDIERVLLAAAHAELGNFDEAVTTQRKLLEMANIPPEMRKEFAARLALYEKKEKYRHP